MPWKNEADRLKLVEDKNGPATRKQKTKKTDIASNKNKGAKRQKVSHNGRLQIKLPIQIAKHKSSKKKGANATPVKGTKAGHKKAVQLRKTKAKKSKQQTVPLNSNSTLSVSSSQNQNLNQNLNLPSSTTPDPRPNRKTCQNPNPHPGPKVNMYPQPNIIPNPNPNPNVNSHTNFNLPFGSVPNQPPAWFPPNQPAFSFPGHGGQWGPNHGFIQPPGYYDYIQLIAQSLMALLCQQQPR
ncbi:hypothetical protein R6Q57_001121 [Mikania cordata]